MSVWSNVRVSGDTLDALRRYRAWLEYTVALKPAGFPAYLRESDRISLGDTLRYLIERHGPKER